MLNSSTLPVLNDVSPAQMGAQALADLNTALASLSAAARVDWALKSLPSQQVMSSSFGAQSAVLLHMATVRRPELPVWLVDTGYLFPETYRFVDELAGRLSLNLKVLQAPESTARFEARHGRLWEQGVAGLAQYNELRKVGPLREALERHGVQTWLTGLRRDQSSTRQSLQPLEQQDGRWKVNPIFDWNDRQAFEYLKQHGLPYHPLWEKGYVSIGDWHTTRTLEEAGSPEATRFFGLKRECGIHDLPEGL